jgi:hypothetical protein
MTLVSALDDLLSRTLAAVPGMLARLEYVASLKAEGRYGHWGLSRVHGERAAQRALTDAHKLLLGEILQTPLHLLVADSETACAVEGRETPAYVKELFERDASLLPQASVSRATTLHFNSVLYALSALTRAQQRATRRDA